MENENQIEAIASAFGVDIEKARKLVASGLNVGYMFGGYKATLDGELGTDKKADSVKKAVDSSLQRLAKLDQKV